MESKSVTSKFNKRYILHLLSYNSSTPNVDHLKIISILYFLEGILSQRYQLQIKIV